MSISMEKFGAEGRFVTYDPYQVSQSQVMVFRLQCHSCGYEPEDVVVAPRLCPKCHSQSWERFAKPGSILENANRY
jgi:Zn finger protein HypA/HybF involved in hydrogenase expression